MLEVKQRNKTASKTRGEDLPDSPSELAKHPSRAREVGLADYSSWKPSRRLTKIGF
jgi:hypothetical protein